MWISVGPVVSLPSPRPNSDWCLRSVQKSPNVLERSRKILYTRVLQTPWVGIWIGLRYIAWFHLSRWTLGWVFLRRIFKDFSLFLFASCHHTFFHTFRFWLLWCSQFSFNFVIFRSCIFKPTFFIVTQFIFALVQAFLIRWLRKGIFKVKEEAVQPEFFVKEWWLNHCSTKELAHLQWHNFCSLSMFRKGFLWDRVLWDWVIWTCKWHCHWDPWHQQSWQSCRVFSGFRILKCFRFSKRYWERGWCTRVPWVCWDFPFFRWCYFAGTEFWGDDRAHRDFIFFWFLVGAKRSLNEVWNTYSRVVRRPSLCSALFLRTYSVILDMVV